jgi:hypothetical protein
MDLGLECAAYMKQSSIQNDGSTKKKTTWRQLEINWL